MIKECKVLSYNKFLNILVFKYNNRIIQTTAVVDPECKTIYVEYKNGKFTVCKKEKYKKFLKQKAEKKSKKNKIMETELVEEVVDLVDVKNEA